MIMENQNGNKKRNPACRFTIAQELEIIQDYQNGNSLRTVGEKYSCSPSTIRNIVKAYGKNTRTMSEARRNYLNYEIDESVFEIIDSQDKAYWLGVMYSDGYINLTQTTKYFGISVVEKDIEWLEKFRIFLQYSGEIKIYEQSIGYASGSNYARLLIGNNKITEDLIKLGVEDHKTNKIVSIPNIPYKDDFIRGYIDGDGSLRKDYPDLRICGNKSFLESIADYFNLPYRLYKDKSIYDLVFNRQASEYLEKRLYKDANYYLDRKYNIAQRSFNSPLTLEEVRKNSEYQGKSLEL